jgi:flagellar basal-body rod protein FlgB
MNLFQDTNINSLNYALKVASTKNEIISENIANVDTPGFKAKKIDFDEVMQNYYSNRKNLPLYTTDSNHIPAKDSELGIYSFARFQNNPSLRNDGNDVNLDYEMSEMASNSVMYSMFSQITSMEFMKLKSAIAGR